MGLLALHYVMFTECDFNPLWSYIKICGKGYQGDWGEGDDNKVEIHHHHRKKCFR